ncbi:glycosyltransferase [Gracilimonas sp. Q87]|uniref:glycosyltransferase n=1 Tax=Gracilimonas sp. Q87 TaxID=3384766 RepID=UPI003984375C
MISFVSVFPPFRGGIAKFSDYLFQHLKVRTKVKAYNFTSLYPSLLFPGNSQYLDSVDTTYAQRVLHSWNPFNWKKAAKEIIADRPDNVIISYWHPFFAPAFIKVITQIKKSSPQTSISVLAHNILPHENFPLGKYLSKNLLDKADHVIVLSEKSSAEAQSLSLGNKVIKLFHPVYEQELPKITVPELKQQYGFTNDDFVLLFFGLVRPYKGLDVLIEGLNEMDLESEGIRPFIVGEFYMDKDSVLSRINMKHRKFYTIIDRFISDREVAEVLTLSDAMVMPYRSATQSGILANAINFKLPCILSDLQGLTEHIEHNKSALVFSSDSVSELKESIYTMMKTETRTTIISELEKLKEELSWEAFTDRLLSKLIK